MSLEVAVLSDDELIEQLTTWAGRVAAGEAVLLHLIGELDAREAWAQWGVLSCAHWVSWRLGLSVATAREKVRVARRLRDLPLLSAELGAGRVSYAQARAITRIATPAQEERWLELARVSTAAELEKAARGVSRAVSSDEPEKEQQPAVRIGWDRDGTLLLTLRVPAAQAPGVLAALDSAQQVEQTDRDARYAQLATELADVDAPADVSAETSDPAAPPFAEPHEYSEPPYPVLRQRVGLFDKRSPQELAALAAWEQERDLRRARHAAAQAWDAHLQAHALAQQLPARRATLADALIRALTRPDGLKPVTVTLLIDPASGWARTGKDELLPPTTLRQVLKTLPSRPQTLTTRPLTATDLQRHDLGRTGRLVSPALRALLGQLDGERCRFPSCDRTRHLHAHHVQYWAAGGRTDLANLVLICTAHHTLIHTHGFQLVLSQDRTLTVRTAADIPVPHHPDLPQHSAHDLDPTIRPFTSDWTGNRFNLDYVVMVMAQHSS